MSKDHIEYTKEYLHFETEFVGDYINRLFYAEQDPDRKEKYRQEILRRREVARDLFNPKRK